MSAPAPRGDARVKVAAIVASAAVVIAVLIYAPGWALVLFVCVLLVLTS